MEGKWKLLILFSLSEGPERFGNLSRNGGGITDKILSKELKLLETNTRITRKVFDSFPPKVEYAITEHGVSLEKVLDELHFWGLLHRQEVLSDFN